MPAELQRGAISKLDAAHRHLASQGLLQQLLVLFLEQLAENHLGHWGQKESLLPELAQETHKLQPLLVLLAVVLEV